MESVEGMEQKLSLEIVTGADYFYFDADKTHARVNVKAIARDSEGIVSTRRSSLAFQIRYSSP